MASAVAPSTPTPPSAHTAKSASASPAGTWRHPRFDDIVRRQNASAFTDSNVKKILWNAGTLIGSFAVGRFVPLIHPLLAEFTSYLYPYSLYIISLLRMLWFINIIIAFTPLIKPKDDLSDIPLTPSQRALLGLDPNAPSSLKPGSQKPQFLLFKLAPFW
ncbi:hypothetical protein GP486_005937 [Trichoglossum hirsutum]|uniref:Uncharacterized protein n=1 Tax=Trichoglossum hirsutum TaxID=265104 RepID=A0A9P8L8C4_9PEZI|nr:hypothetical protein GP486_005937 [Trichoglossum hirsutum]